MQTFNRIVPYSWWRNIALVLIVALVASAIVIVITIIDIALTFPSIPAESLSGLEGGWKILVPIFQQYSKTLIALIGTIGFAFVCFVLFIGINFVRADKVKLLGIEFQASQELTELRRELETQSELVVSLQENVREIQSLIEQQSVTFKNPDEKQYFDYLDKISATSAFAIRPGRSVRASIWLYRKSIDEMRIVAGHRISHATLRTLVMKKDDDGFAPLVLRSKIPLVRTPPEVGSDWRNDPRSTSSTTSILGQPIQIGDTEDWQAILCFSTDRDITQFPKAAFQLTDDAATLKLFAYIISFALTLATSIMNDKNESLIELVYKRYT